MPICGIYQIQHLPSGRIYIGSSSDVERRWKEHVYTLNHGTHRNLYLQRVWNRDGKTAFEFRLLLKTSSEYLLGFEQAVMDAKNCTNRKNGFNIAPRADRKFASAESRRRMSMGNKGRVSPRMKGKRHSEETRKKMSAASKGKPKSEAHKAKMRLRIISDEARRRMSNAAKNRPPISAETRAKLSAGHKGKRHTVTEQMRIRMSEAAKRRWSKSCASRGDSECLECTVTHASAATWVALN